MEISVLFGLVFGKDKDVLQRCANRLCLHLKGKLNYAIVSTSCNKPDLNKLVAS